MKKMLLKSAMSLAFSFGMFGFAYAQACPSGAECYDVTANSASDFLSKVSTVWGLSALPSGKTKIQLRVPAGAYSFSDYVDASFKPAVGEHTEIICMDITEGWDEPPACILDFSNADRGGVYVGPRYGETSIKGKLDLFNGFWVKGRYLGYDDLALGELPTTHTPKEDSAPDASGPFGDLQHGIWADGVGAFLRIGPKTQVTNFYYGITASTGAEAIADGTRVYLGGDANYLAWDGGTLSANDSVSAYAVDISRDLGHGYVSESATVADINKAASYDTAAQCRLGLIAPVDFSTYCLTNLGVSHLTAQNSYTYGAHYAGYIANLGGHLDVTNGHSWYNNKDGILGGVGLWSRYRSHIIADGVVTGFNQWGYFLQGNSTVSAVGTIVADNTWEQARVMGTSSADFTDIIAYVTTPRSPTATGVHCETGSTATLTGGAFYNIANYNC